MLSLLAILLQTAGPGVQAAPRANTATAASLVQTAAPELQDAPPIIVTARRLDDTERALAECLARKCPPDEELRAAIAHAENLFVSGDYQSARLTMRASLGRNARFAKQYPVALGEAWRADSRIAAHQGEPNGARISGFASVDALKAGLNDGDTRILAQRIEVADTFLKQGRWDVATMRYRKVARDAADRGLYVLQGHALLREALMYAAFIENDSEVYREHLREAVDAIRATTRPELTTFRDAAELLLARTNARRGDMTAIDAVAARYVGKPTRRPMLLFSPSIDFKNTILDEDSDARTLSPSDVDQQWIDVGFLIDANGRVVDAEVLRGSPKLKDYWVAPILTSVGKRRYAPLQVPAGSDGVRRVERYTLTDDSGTITGSRMTMAVGRPHVVMTDLTPEPAAARG